MTPDEILDQLEDSLRKLTIEYEAFFGGGNKRPSADLTWRVDNCFRLLAENTSLKFAQRYRLNQLQQRHAVFSRVWRRKLEIKEGGWRRPADRLLGVSGANESTRAVPNAEQCRVDLGHGAEVDGVNIERLYAAFLKARERATESLPPGSLERFRAFVQSKTEQIRSEQGGKAIEASVSLEDGHVKLRLKSKE